MPDLDQVDPELFSRRKQSFDVVAELYHASRPQYPSEIYDHLDQQVGPQRSRSLLEIGAGTGKATVDLLERGYRVTALEPGRAMLSVLERTCERFSTSGQLKTVCLPFEGFKSSESFDIVLGAQSLHWIDQKTVFERIASVLRPKGLLAQIWIFPEPLEPELQKEFDQLYKDCSRMYTRSSGEPAVIRFGRYIEKTRAAVQFREVSTYTHPLRRTFNTAEYLKLLQTHSDHNTLEESARGKLLAGVEQLIEKRGGEIAIDYLVGLILSEKVS